MPQNTTPLYYLVTQTLISKYTQISNHLIPPLKQHTITTTYLYPITVC
jgi:hypothetical protein